MKRVIVAGVGNVLLGDDGFGVEVARRLARTDLPDGTTVTDYGIRGVHLAFELLDPPDFLVLVDAAARGGDPGTLYVIDPTNEPEGDVPDAHSMDPRSVLAAVRTMGGRLPRTRVVGCEPADLSERIELSAEVERAVEPAVEIVRRLIEREVSGEAQE